MDRVQSEQPTLVCLLSHTDYDDPLEHDPAEMDEIEIEDVAHQALVSINAEENSAQVVVGFQPSSSCSSNSHSTLSTSALKVIAYQDTNFSCRRRRAGTRSSAKCLTLARCVS